LKEDRDEDDWFIQITPGGTMKRIIGALVALSLGFFGVALYAAKGDEKVDSRIFELRTYECVPGKMEALQARFRNHTRKLFEKHQMTVIGFWNPTDAEQSQRKLIYLLAFPSQEAAVKSWADFQADPEWKAVKEASEKDGKLAEKIETLTFNIGDIADDNKSAKVQLMWENTSVKFAVAVDFDSRVMKDIEAKTKVNPGTYAAAANYYLDNGKDLNKALDWMNLAIAGNPNAFWNVHAKAKIQKALGDKKGAIVTAQQSLDLAKINKDGDFGYIKLNEDLIKSLK